MRLFRQLLGLLAVLLFVRTGESSIAAAEKIDFVRHVQPVLARHCYQCHGPAKQRNELRLDAASGIVKGGSSGPTIVPGKSGESLLIHAVTGTNDAKLMPPKEPRLSADEIAVLKRWIDEGAIAPKDDAASSGANAKLKHWSVLPVVRPPLPNVKPTEWLRNPIDHFVLARLRKEGLSPSPEADRVTLIRRLSLDLLGLPPSIDEIDAFVNDKRPDAYEQLVDRLLASPHYGERWGRHWLDLARYADSNGYSIDSARSIWKYRDWVIDALNKDMPFDQFTIEQLAGDMLPNATPEQKVATGFHRNTMINQEGGIDLEQFRVESVVDRVNTTGTVWLGLTVGCCQCHDHKFDPISQREYYQLFALFNNANEPELELPTPEQAERRRAVRQQLSELQKRQKGLDPTTEKTERTWEEKLTTEERLKLPKNLQDILAVPENGRTGKQKHVLTAAYRNYEVMRHVVGAFGEPSPALGAHLPIFHLRVTLGKQIAALKKREPEITTSMVMQERSAPRETRIHIQGDFTRKGAAVEPNVPAWLQLPLVRERDRQSNRLDFAKWLVDSKNPATARVTVNRVWQQYFGVGLVETENDFGAQGTPPSHPELLDWLASEFTTNWSFKSLHPLMVTSATYRQSSRTRPELTAVDPNNKLLGRQNRLRLDAEVVRDTALAASGLLNRRIGGPSVFPAQPDGVYQLTQINKNWKPSSGPDRYRRGMYTYFWRSAPHPGLLVFDAPAAQMTCTRRIRSNTPLQALTLLNESGFFELAQGLAGRVLKESVPEERLRYAFRLCLGREPNGKEKDLLGKLLVQHLTDFEKNSAEAKLLLPEKLPPDTDVKQLAAWTAVARVLLNLDEFITRE